MKFVIEKINPTKAGNFTVRLATTSKVGILSVKDTVYAMVTDVDSIAEGEEFELANPNIETRVSDMGSFKWLSI